MTILAKMFYNKFVIIESSNAKESKNHTGLSVVIVVASCIFFFIPTTLIVLGYLSSQPTGSLISPLPPGTLSNVGAQRDVPTPPIDISPVKGRSGEAERGLPIIAAPSDASASSPTNITPLAGSNIVDKTATVSAGLTEITVTDPDIKLASQIYLSPKPGDDAVYSVKSKSEGLMVIEANRPSDIVRYIDYHLINP